MEIVFRAKYNATCLNHQKLRLVKICVVRNRDIYSFECAGYFEFRFFKQLRHLVFSSTLKRLDSLVEIGLCSSVLHFVKSSLVHKRFSPSY